MGVESSGSLAVVPPLTGDQERVLVDRLADAARTDQILSTKQLAGVLWNLLPERYHGDEEQARREAARILAPSRLWLTRGQVGSLIERLEEAVTRIGLDADQLADVLHALLPEEYDDGDLAELYAEAARVRAERPAGAMAMPNGYRAPGGRA